MSSVTNKHDMLTEPHWAIVTYSSVHHEGDERSRTNPGHGYPAYSEEIVKYQSFTDEDEWKECIRDYTVRKIEFSAMKVIPAKVKTEVLVDVDYE